MRWLYPRPLRVRLRVSGWMSSWRSWMMEMADNRRDLWFLVMWKTIWRLWRSDSFLGRPDHTLFRGELRFLRSPKVPRGMLVIWDISDKEWRAPWIKPNALLLFLGVHSRVFITWLTNYSDFASLFTLVVAVQRFQIKAVIEDSPKFRDLSGTFAVALYVFNSGKYLSPCHWLCKRRVSVTVPLPSS